MIKEIKKRYGKDVVSEDEKMISDIRYNELQNSEP